MKIDEDRPLPDHTKLDYNECCTFLILKELFPDRYKTLEISDKPDLQGDNVGVEVTIAGDKNHMEALNNWVKACHCVDAKKRESYIKRMEQLGVVYTGGIQSWPEQISSVKYIIEAVNTKMKKVQQGKYKYFPEYELFIFTDTWMYKTILKETEKFLAGSNAFEFFNRIYVLEIGIRLHIFEKENYQKVTINTSEQSERNIRSKRMIEQAENQE